MKKINQTSEALGSICGVVGAVLMSFKPELAFFSWVIWTFSSLLLGLFAYLSHLKYLLILQMVFLTVNVSGVINTVGNV